MGLTNTGAEYRFERVIGHSPDADLAIIKFSAIDVPYLTLGSSREALEGQRVLVIGNPKGLQGTVSDGLISAFRADHKLLQITAPLSPGSSGSPVLNEEGKVIGVAVIQVVDGQNLNFAIAAEEVGKAERMGTVQSVTPPPDGQALYGLGEQYFYGRGWSRTSAGHATVGNRPLPQAMRRSWPAWAYCTVPARAVPKDYAQARQCFQKATDAGNTDGMYHLGLLYQYGLGVPQDDAQAR